MNRIAGNVFETAHKEPLAVLYMPKFLNYGNFGILSDAISILYMQ
jgi:hypothetical protein